MQIKPITRIMTSGSIETRCLAYTSKMRSATLRNYKITYCMSSRQKEGRAVRRVVGVGDKTVTTILRREISEIKPVARITTNGSI